MTNCAYCGVDIVFGGIRVGNLRYCRSACQQKAEEAEHNIVQAGQVYEGCLAQLRLNPSDPDLRRQALDAGRVYAARKRYREGGRVTFYDETSIANEIDAASAAARSVDPHQAGDAPLSIEERLERLVALREKNLISDEEYERKRAEIIAEL